MAETASRSDDIMQSVYRQFLVASRCAYSCAAEVDVLLDLYGCCQRKMNQLSRIFRSSEAEI